MGSEREAYMIIVLVSNGKGNERADSVYVKLFNNKLDANTFVENTTNTDDKYWTLAEIVPEGQRVGPLRDGYEYD